MTETVCHDHIIDPVLKKRLSKTASQSKCSYCERQALDDEKPFAIEMNDLGDEVWDAANWLYQWTDEGPYYIGDMSFSDETFYGTADVIYDTVEDAVDPAYSIPIVERLVEATIATENWIGNTDPSALGWEAFARTVRFESRFVIVGTSGRPGHEDESPARIAKFLDALLAYVESDLLVDLPADTILYRGRMTDDAAKLERDEISEEPSKTLGPAPSSRAEAGRLSPRGIGLFYAADALATAVAEIALHSNYDEAIIGGFKTTRSLKLLDFSRQLTAFPSIFASDAESRRRWIFARFKEHFTEMIAAPVVLDGREAVDYTPTQVVAEWLRFVPETRIDGIAWPSHATVGEGKNVMLFFGPGSDFRTDPPTETEMRHFTFKNPALTLSRDNITQHHVKRTVQVSPIEDEEP